MPQVRTSGGSVLAAPRIVPVLYASDEASAKETISAFIAGLGASTFWHAAVSEYGVGAATALPPVIVHEPAPAMIDDSVIQTWLAARLGFPAGDGGTGDGGAGDAGGGDGGTAFPAPDGNTIYVLFYPEGTTVTTTTPGYPPSVSCKDFGAYHDEDDAVPVGTVYAVVPRCNGYLGHSGMAFVTGAASHELVEAVTDPYPATAPAYDDVDFDGSGWAFTSGGPEVGDVCKLDPSAFFTPSDFPYTVQRTWSDHEAAAGHDPCVPHVADDPTYFIAYPELDGVEIYPSYYASGIQVEPGKSRTIAVHLVSDAPTSRAWTVSAEEAGSPQVPADPDHLLSFSWDKTTGNNGSVVHLTITRKVAPAGSPFVYVEGIPFVIKSTLGATTHTWWSVVGE